MSDSIYSIGTQGQPWTDEDKDLWLSKQVIKRSYQDEVLSKFESVTSSFDMIQYGSLSIDESRYPLYAMRSKNWQSKNKTVLVTGGVHGYETSGVQGAIRFLETSAKDFSQRFNIIVVPCVSPWGYETINRWNNEAIDPNRSFYLDSPAQESAALMSFINELDVNIAMHIDLHETTDTDNSEFRPALAARDAIEQKNWNIPDGFYLVGDSTKPAADFQGAINQAVAKVTHIAPEDSNGKLIGVDIEQFGVINYAGRELGLCMGLTDAPYVTTTEVYPDSPLVDDENCITAQVAAISAAITFI
ncbi:MULTISPECIES: M14 family metallopeptidase [Colwellia]|uniref:Zinc carboxypeptidase-related protein n=1 Tax=Colwellia psychrerythraea (strain 34H / ATCC BAA-681) TaxID=167879 RepID=Q485Q6_COLP3|nr:MULTISPECIES: M14 family metallocarboxypeptidase [Colwellia]AAZ23959.1 zinc carboxypeptidase-related protein [Colwellia psychrerythraea 34H]